MGRNLHGLRLSLQWTVIQVNTPVVSWNGAYQA